MKITENDIKKMIAESAKRILKEWDEDEREYDYPDDPEFEVRPFYYNADTNQADFDYENLGDGTIYLLNFSVDDYHTENDGIGSYEYWGYTYYDKGTDYGVADSLVYDSCDEAFRVVDGEMLDDEIPDPTPEIIKAATEVANSMIDSLVE